MTDTSLYDVKLDFKLNKWLSLFNSELIAITSKKALENFVTINHKITIECKGLIESHLPSKVFNKGL